MNKITMSKGTFRLLKNEPSFIDGISSLIDMTPNAYRYNNDKTEKEADVNSLNADWHSIGEDLEKAIKIYESKPKQQNTTA